MKTLIICAGLVLVVSNFCSAAGLWRTLPLEAYSIDGNNVIGDAGYPAIYNIATEGLTEVGNLPSAELVVLQGIDGDRIVGNYGNLFQVRGFLHEGAGWIPLDFSLTVNTFVMGIDGDNIVGSYGTNNMIGYADAQHGFIYNIDTQNWIPVDKPGAYRTKFSGIDGTNIVGSVDSHAYLYNMGTGSWTMIDVPGMEITDLSGISGDNIVGACWVTAAGSNPRGCIYSINAQSWTILDAPGAVWTYIYDIDGDNAVGAYGDALDNRYGFIYTFSKADLNKDTKVDFIDFAILAGQWQGAPSTPCADIAPPGGDGVVDFKDLAFVAIEWLAD